MIGKVLQLNNIRFRSGTVRVLLFGLLFLYAPSTVAASPSIPVLLYHHVSDRETQMPELSVSTAEFTRQMNLLRNQGFQTITPSQLISFMRGEPAHLPTKAVLITFDDGYADNYTAAFPILKQLGYSATLFMVGINVDRANRLTTAQIREMAVNNWTIGAHSMTHPDLTRLHPMQLRYEVAGSKDKVEQKTQTPVGYFAYPGGYYNLAALEAVEATPYQGAFSVLTGVNRPERDNLFLLRRIPVFRSTDFEQLLQKLTTPAAKPSLLDY